MQRRIIVRVDTREKTPFLFPGAVKVNGQGRIIEVERTCMKTGDYCLAQHPTWCVIERKASAREIARNFLNPHDKARQLRALDRLAAMAYPILVIERTAGALLTRPDLTYPDPGMAIDELLAALIERRIQLWLVGSCTRPSQRRYVGELLVRAMVMYAEAKRGGS